MARLDELYDLIGPYAEEPEYHRARRAISETYGRHGFDTALRRAQDIADAFLDVALKRKTAA